MHALSDDQLKMVSGGGTMEVQDYLEEYNHYVYLYEH